MNNHISTYFISEFKKNKLYKLLFFLFILLSSFLISFNSFYDNIKKIEEKDYKSYRFMDIKISSSIGFDKDIKNDILKYKDIEGINLTKVYNSKVKISKKKLDVQLSSINENTNTNNKNYINRLKLLKGKYPSIINEGLVEYSFAKKHNIKENSIITLIPKNNNDLRAKVIKVVGIVKTGNYSSSNLIFLKENNFTSNKYNEINITIKGSYNINGKIYKSKVKSKIDEVKTNLITKLNKDRDEKIKKIDEEINETIKNINEINSLELEDIKKQYEETLSLLKDEKNVLTNDKITIKSISNLSYFKTKLNSLHKFKKSFCLISTIISICIICILIVIINKIINTKSKEIKSLMMLGFKKKNIKYNYIILSSIIIVVLNTILGIILSMFFMFIIYLFTIKNFSLSPSYLYINYKLFLTANIICILTNSLIYLIIFKNKYKNEI